MVEKNINWRNFTVIFAIVFVVGMLGWCLQRTLSEAEVENGLIGIANPAAVYCNELGYEYKIDNEPRGQVGYCIFPNKSECDEWQFLKGKCGQEWSYCAMNGYDIITKTGRNPFSREYAVCVTRDGAEIGSVTELMNLAELCLGCNTQLEEENEEIMKPIPNEELKPFENAR